MELFHFDPPSSRGAGICPMRSVYAARSDTGCSTPKATPTSSPGARQGLARRDLWSCDRGAWG